MNGRTGFPVAFDEGYSEIDFNLAINIDELLSVIEALSPYLEKRAKTLKAQNEKQPPKGFASQSRAKQVERDPEEAERKIRELEAELALRA